MAKAVVTATLWTVAGAVISTASFAVSQAILDGRHAGVSITDPDAFPAWLAATLLAPVCALVGLGLGALIRHSITTIVTSIVLLAMLPQFFSTRREATAEINHAMLLSAWQRLTHAYGQPAAVGSLYAPFTQSWIVYAAWPLVALILAVIVIRRRDV
jgi:ABC-2 type transport system permease protein